MNRLEKLKEQYPDFTADLFDLFSILDTSKSYKYVPLLCKLFKERMSELVLYNEHNKLFEKYGVTRENTSTERMLMYSYFLDIFGSNRIEIIETFIDNIENKRLSNADVTSYQNFNDIRKANSLAEINKYKKILEKEVRIEFEDEIWIALRPLSFESSLKYGATTTWCTASKNNKEPFIRYWKGGVLVYFINKINGYKFAGFKDVSSNDISFWDVEDNRVDSMILEIQDYMLVEIKRIFSSQIPNMDFCNEDSKNILIEEYNMVNTPRWEREDQELNFENLDFFTVDGTYPLNIEGSNLTTTTSITLTNNTTLGNITTGHLTKDITTTMTYAKHEEEN
jgi:hypothetical protein